VFDFRMHKMVDDAGQIIRKLAIAHHGQALNAPVMAFNESHMSG
jgi:hypothetical protein